MLYGVIADAMVLDMAQRLSIHRRHGEKHLIAALVRLNAVRRRSRSRAAELVTASGNYAAAAKPGGARCWLLPAVSRWRKTRHAVAVAASDVVGAQQSVIAKFRSAASFH